MEAGGSLGKGAIPVVKQACKDCCRVRWSGEACVCAARARGAERGASAGQWVRVEEGAASRGIW